MSVCHHRNTALTPDPIDVHVGGRVRRHRILLGLSHARLGIRLGLSSQQVQECENGTTCISVAMLYRFARALNVPAGYFFEDMEDA